jgi:hypothetical protein
MAKQRYVNTRFWDDGDIRNLDPKGKLLFLYLLTNPLTNIAGIYEITIERMHFDTALTKEMIVELLERFEKEKKMYYRDGWIAIANFIKHQNQQSPKIQAGIEKELKLAPEKLKSLINRKGMDTLSHLNLNSNKNTNSNSDPNTRLKDDGIQKMRGKLVDKFSIRRK